MSYSPTLGRWMQADPSGYVDGLNLNEFVGSNPTNRLDPSGLQIANASSQADAIAEWKRSQKKKIAEAFAALCPQGNFTSISNCACTPEKCKSQAKEIADALVDAVAAKREKGEQLGGVAGNVGAKFGNFDCGDWQILAMNAMNGVIDKHIKAKDSCFNSIAGSGTGPWYFWQHGVPNHQWMEIAAGNNPANTVVIDPWPTGGKGDLIDSSANGGWPTTTQTPYYPFPKPPKASAATQPSSQP